MAGLPGTGLGGIFYILLICWMAARETWLLSKGASRAAHWTKIARFATLATCIIAALWAEGWLLERAILMLSGFDGNWGDRHHVLRALTPAVAATPFFLLAILLGGMHITRLVRRRPVADMVVAVKDSSATERKAA
jgi:arginine exporter protein ArgO